MQELQVRSMSSCAGLMGVFNSAEVVSALDDFFDCNVCVWLGITTPLRIVLLSSQ